MSKIKDLNTYTKLGTPKEVLEKAKIELGKITNENIDTKPIPEAVTAVDTKRDEKQINPGTDKGNYIIQIISNNQILKQVIALNSTVNIIYLGENSAVADIK